jgi:hypothetical protein
LGLPIVFLIASGVARVEAYEGTLAQRAPSRWTRSSAAVSGTVATRRDLADGVYKPQLQVTLPSLPLGPARIAVSNTPTSTPVLTIPDTDFTVASIPLAIPDEYGGWSYQNQQAAVDRDGIVYLSLDLSGLTQPLVFDATAVGLPLRFGAEDVVFTNAQGFLTSAINLTGGGLFTGAFVGSSLSVSIGANVRYDETLRGQ